MKKLLDLPASVWICSGIIIILSFGISIFMTLTNDSANVEETASDSQLFAWRFDEDSGTLFVSGNENMPSDCPWEEYREDPSVKHIVVEEGVTEIGQYWFSMLYATDVSLPTTLTRIDYSAFSNCVKLKTITIPDSVSWIGSAAFLGCMSLEHIHLPESLTKLQGGTFAYCSSLQEIIIPEGVLQTDSAEFKECTALKAVYLPVSLEHIGPTTFNTKHAVTIYYSGSQTQWERIYNYDTENTMNADIHYLAEEVTETVEIEDNSSVEPEETMVTEGSAEPSN